MQYRQFGNTGKTVSALGFGCMRLPEIEKLGRWRIDEDKAIPMLLQAYEAGVNYFDTAFGYCHENSQYTLGRAVKRIINGTGYRFDGFNGSGDEDGSAQYLNWINTHKGVNATLLKEKAVAALRRFIQPDSELYELWSDNKEMFPKWKDSIEQTIGRLSV